MYFIPLFLEIPPENLHLQPENTYLYRNNSILKVSVKENEVPTEKILVARVFSLQKQVIYQIKAKRLNYLIKDSILSNFKRRLSFLLSNSEVSSLLLKLQPFRVVKLTDKRPKKGCEEISDFPL